MCGRIVRERPDYEIAWEGWSPRQIALNLGATSYNVGPGRDVTVVIATDAPKVQSMYWGLIRPFTKAGMPTPINARSETALEKPMFRALMTSKRCVIPATGYYEWQREGKSKQPYYLHPSDQEMFALAGIYDSFERDGEQVESFTILTTTPAESIDWIHDRMPVILHPDDVGPWLDPELHEGEIVQSYLRPYPAMDAYAVSSRVGNVRNDDPELIEPLS